MVASWRIDAHIRAVVMYNMVTVRVQESVLRVRVSRGKFRDYC